MPINYSAFRRRADQDPEASQKAGLSKIFAGWKLMLGDDRKLLRGETSRRDFWKRRRDLLD